MVIYHAISTYQLLSMMIHKEIYHSNDKAVIMISDSLCDKFPNYEELGNYFEDIIVFNLSLVNISKNNFEEVVNSYFKKLFKKYKYNLSDFDDIYVGCAHFYFGIYLAINKIPFVFFEDAAGLLSRPEVLIGIDSQNILKHDYNLEYGLYDGTCKSITKKVCNLKSQIDGFYDEKAVDFNVISSLLKLDTEKQNEIKGFFISFKSLDIPENSILFLTQHFFNLGVMSFEEQILIYQMVIDYFFESDTVIFKPHPDDIMYYDELFENSTIIKEKFPAEFLPLIFSKKPKCIATISSTAINNLEEYFYNSFKLDTEFEKEFYRIHRYFTVLNICNMIKKQSDYIKLYGTNDVVFKRLSERYIFNYNFNIIENIDELKEDNKANIYIIDDNIQSDLNQYKSIVSFLKTLNTDSVVIFVNSKEKYCFYDINNKDIWNQIVPVVINKSVVREEEVYVNEDDEIIYVYSKNNDIRKEVEKFTMEKDLKNTGLNIKIENMTPEQQRIKVLEGILKATEDRLLYYINLVDEKDSDK